MTASSFDSFILLALRPHCAAAILDGWSGGNKELKRGLCDAFAQLHDVGNRREVGLLGFFTALPFQTSSVNKQSGRRCVSGSLKFSTRASGAVKESGVHRDNPTRVGY